MDEVSIPAAFAAGFLSFASPCVLPLVPIYVANLGGIVSLSADAKRWSVLLHSISFVAGFTLVYTAIGASIGLIGVIFPRDLLRIIGGAIIILFGILLIVAVKVPRLNYWMHYSRQFSGNVGYARSALMGVLFAFTIGPCTAPILASIYIWASAEQTALKGALLLAVFSLGLGIPFILVGLALGTSLPAIRWLNRRANIISVASGILLMVLGILILTNTLPQ